MRSVYVDINMPKRNIWSHVSLNLQVVTIHVHIGCLDARTPHFLPEHKKKYWSDVEGLEHTHLQVLHLNNPANLNWSLNLKCVINVRQESELKYLCDTSAQRIPASRWTNTRTPTASLLHITCLQLQRTPTDAREFKSYLHIIAFVTWTTETLQLICKSYIHPEITRNYLLLSDRNFILICTLWFSL
jgi:hypothetical protein